MTPDPRPSYPRTPAYGEGHPAPSAAPVLAEPAAGPRSVRLALVMSVALNVVTLVGVLALGWPAGNVFLLFWLENAVLGLVTLARISTSTGPGRLGTGLFFCLHYGIFCAVHLVFTLIVAGTLGVDRSWLFLAPPVALLLARYAVELGTTWLGSRGLRHRTTPRTAMMQPYPRVIVLHLAVLLTFGGGIVATVGAMPGGPLLPGVHRLLEGLPSVWQHRGVLAVAVLLLIKTLVDLVTTRRALRA